MRCAQCGIEVDDDASFCPHCGERLKTDRPAAPEPAGAAEENAAANSHATAARRLDQDPTRFGTAAPPEEDFWSGTFSPKAMVGPAAGAAALSLLALVGVILWWPSGAGWLTLLVVLVLVWGSLGLLLAYRRLSIRYRLTRYRLFHERGLLARTTDRIETIDIDDVTVHQGIIERILGIGTILVTSGDRTHPALRMPGIDRVQQVANLIDSARRAERQRRGLHLETG
jgi:membrane protein YdbS with pleckstrin-like domain